MKTENELKINVVNALYDFFCELYAQRIIEIRFNNDTLLYSEIAKFVNNTLTTKQIENYQNKYSLENIDFNKLKEYLK